MPDEERYYSLHDAAAILGVSEYRLRKWMRGHQVPGEKVGRGYRIPASALGLMPRDARQLAAEALDATVCPPEEEWAWRVACWRNIAVAALQVHAEEFVKGCDCRVCAQIRVMALRSSAPDLDTEVTIEQDPRVRDEIIRSAIQRAGTSLSTDEAYYPLYAGE